MKSENSSSTYFLDGSGLSFADVVRIAFDKNPSYKVAIKKSALKQIHASRNYIDGIVADTGVKETPFIYGVNTGFGANKHKLVEQDITTIKEKLSRIAYNLIASHAIGVGERMPREVVRAAMLLRANTLIKGYSGVRVEVIQKILDLINADITPVVPGQGSVGGSGDLAPLSHMALVFLLNPYSNGSKKISGKVERKKKGSAGEYEIVEAEIGIQEVGGGIIIKDKEGLALNNGTQFLTGITTIAAHHAASLAKISQISSAMIAESFLSTIDAYDPLIHKLRPHSGQREVAKTIRDLLKGSTFLFDPTRDLDVRFYKDDMAIQHIEKVLGLRKKYQPVKEPIQDFYSVRCTPQVIGACLDTINYVKTILTTEFNSVNDNPIVNPAFGKERKTGKAISGGNFHGEPIAFAADFLKIAIAELGSVSERRVAAIVDPDFSRGLPAFLTPEIVIENKIEVKEEGMHSGLMVAQYLAAALVSENKVLAHPASVDSITTSAGVEDHVSMGTHGARQALMIAKNVYHVIAVELLAAAQAIALRKKQSLHSLYNIDLRINEAKGKLLLLENTSNSRPKTKAQIAQCKVLIEKLLAFKKLLDEKAKPFQNGKGTAVAVKYISDILHKNGLDFPISHDVVLHHYIDVIAESLMSGEFLRKVIK